MYLVSFNIIMSLLMFHSFVVLLLLVILMHVLNSSGFMFHNYFLV